MNYMIVLFVYELNILDVSIYYVMFLRKKRIRKKKCNMVFYLWKEWMNVGLYAIIVIYFRCHVAWHLK